MLIKIETKVNTDEKPRSLSTEKEPKSFIFPPPKSFDGQILQK